MSAIHSISNRFVLNVSVLVIGLILVPVSGRTNENSQQQLADCLKDAQQSEVVKLNTGIMNEQIQIQAPLQVTIPVGIDARNYHECLLRQGLIKKSNTEAYVRLVEQCRNETRTQKVVLGQGATSIVSSNTKETFAECVHRSSGILEVELIESTDTPLQQGPP